MCISPVPGSTLIGLECVETEIDTKSERVSISSVMGQKHPSSVYPNVENAQDIIAFDSSSEDEEGHGSSSFMSNKFSDANTSVCNGRLSPEGSSLGTTGSVDGDETDSSQDENVSESDENDTSEDEDKRKRTRKHHSKHKSRLSLDSSRTDDGRSLTDFIAYETPADEGSTVWLGSEDGRLVTFKPRDRIYRPR